MKRSVAGSLVILAILSIALIVSGPAFSRSHSGVEDLSRPSGNEPPMLGIHWARGFNPSYLLHRAHGQGHGPFGSSSSPDMTYHGGNILADPVVQNIFWGTSWSTDPGDKIVGLQDFYTGFNGSYYAATSDEYTGSNGTVSPYLTYDPARDVIDTSKATNGNKTSSILAEVCKEITNPDPNGNGYYAVYVDLPRKGSYCAYHSWGSCSGIPVQFAFFWKLDGDAGCDPQSTVQNESEGLAALANVSAHELSETRTDPNGDGWYDSSGEENGDKCVWTFNDQPVTFTNGSQWKLQGEWSNLAYDNGYGYANSAAQDGCLDGDGDDGNGNP